MKLIVGLGNPGEKYAKTRHNIGYRVIDTLIKSDKWKTSRVHDKKRESIITINKNNNTILLKPLTFMNDAGRAIASAIKDFNIQKEDLWVIHDDVDIKLGKIKIQFGRGSAGHNGVKSIIQTLGTKNFYRWRVGIGKPPKEENINTAEYVLQNFTQEEEQKIAISIKNIIEAIHFALDHDIVATMNKYN